MTTDNILGSLAVTVCLNAEQWELELTEAKILAFRAGVGLAAVTASDFSRYFTAGLKKLQTATVDPSLELVELAIQIQVGTCEVEGILSLPRVATHLPSATTSLIRRLAMRAHSVLPSEKQHKNAVEIKADGSSKSGVEVTRETTKNTTGVPFTKAVKRQKHGHSGPAFLIKRRKT